MSSSLSAYWVKFFKGAGFPQDVATKHAVVFSNNRIKPDMLPDLDKPSLKEMGITLMGDMIAILRYAKKVVEETTCEKFLVDTEGNIETSKPIVKKTVIKASATAVSSKIKSNAVASKKIVKIPTSSAIKKTVIKKSETTPTLDDTIRDIVNCKKRIIIKRQIEEDNSEVDESPKKLRIFNNNSDKEYTVSLSEAAIPKPKQISTKPVEQKKTVFDRLGDSSVTSTTNPVETSLMFNITGLGKDVLKRSVSVFNRLGDIDAKKDSPTIQTGILKNGTSSTGILKTRSPSTRTSILTANKIVPKNVGTMRADQEVNKKVMSSNVSQLVKTNRTISFKKSSLNDNKTIKSNVTSGKLASERLTSVPAKARLGIAKTNSTKQVTFNKVATVHEKRSVFSRLGI